MQQPKEVPRRTPVLAVLGFNAALLMAPLAALASVTTYVPETEGAALAVAAGLALGSIVLVALLWRRLPRFIRVLAGLVLLMAGFSVWAIAQRLVW